MNERRRRVFNHEILGNKNSIHLWIAGTLKISKSVVTGNLTISGSPHEISHRVTIDPSTWPHKNRTSPRYYRCSMLFPCSTNPGGNRKRPCHFSHKSWSQGALASSCISFIIPRCTRHSWRHHLLGNWEPDEPWWTSVFWGHFWTTKRQTVSWTQLNPAHSAIKNDKNGVVLPLYRTHASLGQPKNDLVG